MVFLISSEIREPDEYFGYCAAEFILMLLSEVLANRIQSYTGLSLTLNIFSLDNSAYVDSVD